MNGFEMSDVGPCTRCGRVTPPRSGHMPRYCAVCGCALPVVPVPAAVRRRLRSAPPAAAAALMLGICSLLPMLGLPLGIVAIVLGCRANRQILDSDGFQSGRGMAVAGTVLGTVGAIISLCICCGIR